MKTTVNIDLSDCKRIYTDLQLYKMCPDCGCKLKSGHKDHPINYPNAGDDDYIYFCCDECGFDAEVKIKIVSSKMEIEFNHNEMKLDGD